MYQVTLAENPAMQIPILGFRGSPTGIDVLAVARTGWLPQINTGMAGRVAGTGQVGAGLVQPPRDRKSTRLNSSHANISYAVFCLKKKESVIVRYPPAPICIMHMHHHAIPD